MTQKKPQWAVIIRQGRTERILFSLLPVLFIGMLGLFAWDFRDDPENLSSLAALLCIALFFLVPVTFYMWHWRMVLDEDDLHRRLNIAGGRGNPDVPFSHVLVGVTAVNNSKGKAEYYAVRYVVEERKNQNPILVKANVLGRLYSENAKKMRPVNVQVAPQSSALAHTKPHFLYTIANMLQDVKDVFDDTFSNDVYRHFGMTRKVTDFSEGQAVLMPDGTMKRPGNLQHQLRDYDNTLSDYDRLFRWVSHSWADLTKITQSSDGRGNGQLWIYFSNDEPWYLMSRYNGYYPARMLLQKHKSIELRE